MKTLSRLLLTTVFTVSMFLLSGQATRNIANAECGMVSIEATPRCLNSSSKEIVGGEMCKIPRMVSQINDLCCQSFLECIELCEQGKVEGVIDSNYDCEAPYVSTPSPNPGSPTTPPSNNFSCTGYYGTSTANEGTLTITPNGTTCCLFAGDAISPYIDCSTTTSMIPVCIRAGLGTSCPIRYSCNIQTKTCNIDPNGPSLNSNCCSNLATVPPDSGWCEQDVSLDTAIGCIPINDKDELLSFILRWSVEIGGGIAFLLIIYAGFMIMTSAGNPERLKAGQELLTSAISGLILLIFSVVILKIIGVDILGLDKFGFNQ